MGIREMAGLEQTNTIAVSLVGGYAPLDELEFAYERPVDRCAGGTGRGRTRSVKLAQEAGWEIHHSV